jgi:outer membrane lipoprotein-sorting protein
MIFNVQQDVRLDQDLFKIDYQRNIDLNKTKNSNR